MPPPTAEHATSSTPPASHSSVAERAKQRAFLRSALESNPLFHRLDDARVRDELVASFTRSRFDRGDLIVRYGDRDDRRFFVLEHGEVSVEIPATKVTKVAEAEAGGKEAVAASAGAAVIAATSSAATPAPASGGRIVSAAVKDENVRVDLLERGASFGEVSLLYDVPRCASVRCVTRNCHAWSIGLWTRLSRSGYWIPCALLKAHMRCVCIPFPLRARCADIPRACQVRLAHAAIHLRAVCIRAGAPTRRCYSCCCRRIAQLFRSCEQQRSLNFRSHCKRAADDPE